MINLIVGMMQQKKRNFLTNHMFQVVVVSLLLIAGLPGGTIAQVTQSKEYAVKAAFLINFFKFVEWPENYFSQPTSPYQICIFGNDPFGSSFDDFVRGKKVKSRDVAIKRTDKVVDIGSCHVVFFQKGNKWTLIQEVLKEIRMKPVLTVGEHLSFLDAGGMVRFVIQESKIRFEINIGAAKDAQLKIASALLRLATYVKGVFKGE